MDELRSNDALLRTVGASLSNWSLVELQLATLFTALTDMPDQNKANALFATIISFETRLAVCDRLMLLENVDELHSEMWVKMPARLSKFYKKRHELAHFSVGWDPSGEPTIQPFSTAEKIIYEKVRTLSLEQIRERSAKFIELHMAAGWFASCAFWRRVKSHEGPRPETGEPPLVPRLRELATLSLDERKQQRPTLEA